MHLVVSSGNWGQYWASQHSRCQSQGTWWSGASYGAWQRPGCVTAGCGDLGHHRCELWACVEQLPHWVVWLVIPSFVCLLDASDHHSSYWEWGVYGQDEMACPVWSITYRNNNSWALLCPRPCAEGLKWILPFHLPYSLGRWILGSLIHSQGTREVCQLLPQHTSGLRSSGGLTAECTFLRATFYCFLLCVIYGHCGKRKCITRKKITQNSNI